MQNNIQLLKKLQEKLVMLEFEVSKVNQQMDYCLKEHYRIQDAYCEGAEWSVRGFNKSLNNVDATYDKAKRRKAKLQVEYQKVSARIRNLQQGIR